MTDEDRSGMSSVYVTDALKFDLSCKLEIAWRRYVDLFGEPPHGTMKQMQALVELLNINELANGVANHAIAKWYAEGQGKVGGGSDAE